MPPKTGSRNPPSRIARVSPTAPRHRGYRPRRPLRDHQLEHFHRQAFGGEGPKPRPRTDAGEIAGAIGFARAIGGVNAEKPEDAQAVFGDALVRISNESHPPCLDI